MAAPAVPVLDPPLVQLLTPEGERVPDPVYDPWVADVDDEALRGLYRDLVLTRRFDTEATALQRQGELGLWASLLGQEAAQVGAGRALAQGDMVFPTYREHGIALMRGIDPVSLLGLFRGTSLGGWDPAATGFGLYTIVIGSQTLHATGYAMGVQLEGADVATLACFGDGATSQGDVHEAFVWASVRQAPVVFLCQNNGWAISEPTERQTRVPLVRRAVGYGMPGVQVDGNDVLATLAVTRRALADARSGQGPTLVEAVTYRMGAHTTSDDPTRYRLDVDLDLWRQRDPLERVEAYLVRTGAADAAYLDSVRADADALTTRVRAGCLALPAPPPETMFDHVYAELPADLAAQRAGFVAWQAGFDAVPGAPAAVGG